MTNTKKQYARPTLTHQGSVEARTLGYPDGANGDTGVCPACWKGSEDA